jgi:hypothetical protein
MVTTLGRTQTGPETTDRRMPIGGQNTSLVGALTWPM